MRNCSDSCDSVRSSATSRFFLSDSQLAKSCLNASVPGADTLRCHCSGVVPPGICGFSRCTPSASCCASRIWLSASRCKRATASARPASALPGGPLVPDWPPGACPWPGFCPANSSMVRCSLLRRSRNSCVRDNCSDSLDVSLSCSPLAAPRRSAALSRARANSPGFRAAASVLSDLRMASAETRMRSPNFCCCSSRAASAIACPALPSGPAGVAANLRADSASRSVRSARRSCSAANRRRASSPGPPAPVLFASFPKRRSASANWRASICRSPMARRRSSGREPCICCSSFRSCCEAWSPLALACCGSCCRRSFSALRMASDAERSCWLSAGDPWPPWPLWPFFFDSSSACLRNSF